MQTTKISENISFTSIINPRFKTNLISVYLSVPLSESTASLYSLLPNVLRRGCESYPDFITLNRTLGELYGANLSCDVRAFGSRQLVSLGVSAVDDSLALGEEITAQCARLICEVLLRPRLAGGVFDEAEVALERANLIDSIEAEINDKRSYALRRGLEEMFSGQALGVSPLGTVESVKKITPKALAEAYETLLAEAEIEIMFVGRGNEKKAEAIFREEFSECEGLGAKSAGDTAGGAPAFGGEKNVVEKMEILQSKLVLGFLLPELTKEETVAAIMLNAVFGSGVSSKLFLNVREKLSLCYYCASRYDRAGGYFTVDSGVEAEKVEEAKAEILRQLELCRSGEITDDELEFARVALRGAVKSVSDSPHATEGFYLSRILLGESETPEEYAEKLDAVGKDEIVAVAKKLTLDTTYLLTCKEGEC